MGRVFLGERRGEGFLQRAAVKLLSVGAQESLRHQLFLAERGILARLEHPGIARMLDAGVADDGTPYLVMELVEGRTITQACRETRASVD
ncbi:MAG: protein kinase [Thermoanaerobaculia bacterium]|nr:protein kinase [Thermoanaerobaculia bacterium]